MKNLNHLMYFALLFSGLILITGCSEMEAPTAANAGQQSLLKSSNDDDDDDDEVGVRVFRTVDIDKPGGAEITPPLALIEGAELELERTANEISMACWMTSGADAHC